VDCLEFVLVTFLHVDDLHIVILVIVLIGIQNLLSFYSHVVVGLDDWSIGQFIPQLVLLPELIVLVHIDHHSYRKEDDCIYHHAGTGVLEFWDIPCEVFFQVDHIVSSVSYQRQALVEWIEGVQKQDTRDH